MAKKKIVDEEMHFNLVVNGDQAQQELYDTEKAIRNLKDEGKALQAERAKEVKQNGKNTEAYKRLSKAIKENQAEIKEETAKLKEMQNRMGLNAQSMATLQRRARELRLQLRHMIPGSADYIRLENELKVVNTRLKELRGSAQAAQGSLSKLAGGFNKYAALGASVVASITGVVISLQRIIDYNGKLSDSLADVRKTTGLTTDEVNELNKSFGAFNTRTSRVELLKLAEDAGRLGITGVENLRAYTEQANKLRVALKDDLSETQIMEIGKMVNIYKVGEATSKDFAGAMDALGSAINEVSYSGANQAGYLVEYLKRQAGVASQTRISAADNVGYAATFDEIGQSVEISATMMNKVFIDMFENTSEYAKIAGMDLKEFSELLATDANEAMLKFLEGLNGNNDGMAVMVQRLDKLNVGGTRGVQALSALASSTETIRSRQETANRSLQEATSLTDEYNIKNNNLAAVLEKISRRIQAIMSNDAFVGFLTRVTKAIAKLIGVTDDLNVSAETEVRMAGMRVRSNQRLANSSQKLLNEYLDLKKDGVEPTEEAKSRLDAITLELKDSLGDSVIAIDKETGAFKLNTEEVKNQIKLKRLAADQEAAALVSRLKGIRERRKELEFDQIAADQELETRRKMAGLEQGQLIDQRNKTKAEKDYEKALLASVAVKAKAYELSQQQLQIEEELKRLNYDESIVDLIYGDDDGDKPTPHSPGGSNEDKKNREKLLEQLKRDILKATQDTQDARIEMLEDAYLEELVKLRYAHNRKMENLREMLMSEEELMKQPLELRKKYAERNEAINKQMEAETEVHTFREAALIEKGIAQELEKKEKAFEKEMQQRKINQSRELAFFSGSEEEKQALQEQFNKENLQRQEEHLMEMLRHFQMIMDSGEFKGFNLELLTEEQKEVLISRLDELGLKLEEVGIKRKELEGKTDDGWNLGDGADLDILGFSAGQWEEAFKNLETLEDKLQLAGMAVHSFSEAWGMYYEFVNAAERNRYKEFEKNVNAQRESLKRNLDRNLISERQYDNAIKELERETEKRKEEMEYNQNMRAWRIQMLQSVSSTALAVAKALPNLVLAKTVGILGGVQTGIIAANKPVKGFEEGLYPDWIQVQREQDGKLFNARPGEESFSGLIKEPTLVGERPELVISNPDLKKFNPAVTQTVIREIRRVRGYEEGYTSPAVEKMLSTDPGNEANLSSELITEMIGLLRELRDQGIMAYLVRDMENTKKLQDDLERLKQYKQNAEL